MKFIIVLYIIYYTIKYDFEMITPYKSKSDKSNRFVNLYYSNKYIIKQFHDYMHYSIDSMLNEKIKIPFLNKSGFGRQYIIYCISLLPKWISIENRYKFNYSVLPKIDYIDKKQLLYKEERIRTILRYDCYYNKERVKMIIQNDLVQFDKELQQNNMVFLFLEKKNMCITKDGKLKIIEGELLSQKHYELLRDFVNPHYIFKKYNNCNNIYI